MLYFHDLDHDGYDERILFSFNAYNRNNPTVEYRKMTGLGDATTTLVNQINLEKHWFSRFGPAFYDVNNDGQDEMFMVAHQEDSLYILGIKPWCSSGKPFLVKFLTTISHKDGEPDVFISKLILHDLNEDLHKEFVFSILGGWSAEPRCTVSYDLFNDSLIIRDHKHAMIILTSIVEDSTSGPVMLHHCWTPGNKKLPPHPYYSDSISWFTAFDKNLDFLFSPVKDTRYRSVSNSLHRFEDSILYIYTVFYTLNRYDTTYIRKYNTKGELIKERKVLGRHFITDKSNLPGDLFIYDEVNGTTYELNPDLSFGRSCMLLRGHFTLDLQDDGACEYVNFDNDSYEFFVIPDDFSERVNIPLPGTYYVWHAEDIKLEGTETNLLIQLGEDIYYCHYFKNPFYWLQYPAYLLIWSIISFFLYFLLRDQKRRLEQKFEQENRMNELEILTIKNQIDPHFTFNAINTISSFVMKEEKQKTHDFLANFSMLIRNALNNSREISVVLGDEAEFVKNYLTLQQMRFNNSFEFEFDIKPDVDLEQKVPRMIIQTFAENAVKHGLKHYKGKGRLDIIINRNNDILYIEIIDNGVGRAKAKKLGGYSTGKGHEIINRIIKMYFKLTNIPVGYNISDIRDEAGNVAGTRVVVDIGPEGELE